MSELKRRLKKLAALEGKVDYVLLANSGDDANFFYFTNSSVSGIFYYDFSRPVIFTSRMEFARAKKSWVKNVRIMDAKTLSSLKGKIGVDKKSLTAERFTKIKQRKVDISAFLERTRATKSKYEIACIKKACKIATEVYEKAEKEIGRKMTELELKGLIEYMMHKRGATPSFPTIVAGGTNVMYPHHEATTKKITSPLLIDMGVRYNGYCSDITRTTGSPYDDIIRKVFEEIEPMLKPGTKAFELDKRARAILGWRSKYFVHSLGHGIGLAVHEKPPISEKSRDVMMAGMTFAIEPGIYVKRGIRHEEDYLLTEEGAVKLT